MRRGTTHLGRFILGLAILAFLLPFATVGCGAPRGYGGVGGGVTATYRGVTLALGGAPELRAPEGSSASPALTAEDVSPPMLLVTAALALTIAAFVRSLAAARRRAAWVAGLAAGAAAFTILAQVDLNRTWTDRIVERLRSVQPAALQAADPNSFVLPAIGFWILLVLLALAAVLNVGLALTERRAPPSAAESERPVPLTA